MNSTNAAILSALWADTQGRQRSLALSAGLVAVALLAGCSMRSVSVPAPPSISRLIESSLVSVKMSSALP